MLKNLTAHDFISQMKMMRTKTNQVILVLEGPSDCKFFNALINEDSCSSMPVNSRATALEVANLLDSTGLSGILIIVDADFSYLANEKPPTDNVVFTDCHDVETLIIDSDAWRTFVIEYASDEKVRQLSASKPYATTRAMLFEAALPIGIMRWISSRDSLDLGFKKIDIARLVKKESLEVDIAAVARAVIQKNPTSGVTHRDIVRLAESLPDEEMFAEQLCRGHDLVCILSVAMKQCFATRKQSAATPEILSSMLRLAYSPSEFRQTNMYQEIEQWCSRNGYPLIC